MKVAILSDIHANLEALEASLEVVEQLEVDEVICLGDIVGYGPDPDACVQLVRQHCRTSLLGNHDEAIIRPDVSERFNDYARWAVQWTADHLDEQNKQWLAHLPRTSKDDNVLYVHSSPLHPEKWTYIFSRNDAVEQFTGFTETLCFVGHTHHPFIFCEDPETAEFSSDRRFIINVGSVGQPRDGNPQLCFGLFDTERWEFSHVRAPYDVRKTAEKIVASGLPSLLGERLLYGR